MKVFALVLFVGIFLNCNLNHDSFNAVESYSSCIVISEQTDHHIFPNYNEVFGFKVKAIGDSLKYQWQSGNDWYAMNDIPGATDSIYSKVMTRSEIGMIYRCRVFNSQCAVTTNGSIVVDLNKTPPVITDVCDDINANVGDEVVLYIDGNGSDVLNVQWRKNGIDIPDANAMYNFIENAQISDTGSYSCVLYNDYGRDSTREILVNINFKK